MLNLSGCAGETFGSARFYPGLQERVHALQAESWTGYTIKHAMKNRMTAASKAARAAAAAAPDGP